MPAFALQAEDLARILIPAGVAFAVVMIRAAIRALRRPARSPLPPPPAPVPARPVAAPRPVLRGIAGAYKDTDIPFDGKPIIIGRDPGASNLILPQDCAVVSSRHCQIKFEQGRFLLEDLWSTNGTFAGGKSVAPGTAVELKPGARFHLGDPANSFEVRFN